MRLQITNANVDADTFNLWLARDLVPKLPAGVVLVMDNATFHWRADTIGIVARAGRSLEYMPPYDPDLNLIEHKLAQAKARRRKPGQTWRNCFGISFESFGYISGWRAGSVTGRGLRRVGQMLCRRTGL